MNILFSCWTVKAALISKGWILQDFVFFWTSGHLVTRRLVKELKLVVRIPFLIFLIFYSEILENWILFWSFLVASNLEFPGILIWFLKCYIFFTVWIAIFTFCLCWVIGWWDLHFRATAQKQGHFVTSQRGCTSLNCVHLLLCVYQASHGYYLIWSA